MPEVALKEFKGPISFSEALGPLAAKQTHKRAVPMDGELCSILVYLVAMISESTGLFPSRLDWKPDSFVFHLSFS